MSTSGASTNSSAAATSSRTTNSTDPTWKYTGRLDPNNAMKVFCKLCQKQFSGGIARAKEHLTQKPGQVRKCSKVTIEIMKEINDYIKDQTKKRGEKNRLNSLMEGHDKYLNSDGEEEIEILEGGGGGGSRSGASKNPTSDATSSGSKKKRIVASTQRGPMDAHFKPDYKKMKQTQIDHFSPYKEQEKKDAWKAFAVWAYEVGLPFNVVRVPSFQTMVYAIGKYGIGMEAPSYYHMRVTLLKEVLEDTQNFVSSFHPFWKKYGCSIMSDFWTDGKGRSLINFLVNCPKGTVFLKSIDASEHVKHAEYIVDLIERVIDFVGVENVVQFITDNGSNYKRAGSILEEKYPKMFWAPCAAHCLNLMLKELSESKEAPLNKIGKVLLEARSIVVFIYNHGRVLDMMRKFTKKKELHRSCVTRFASQFYTLESLQRNKNALRMMFVSNAWIRTDFAKTVEGKRVARIVSRVRFWEDLRFSCSILAPLVDVLRLVDTEEKPCMGYLQEAMDRAKELIKKNIGEDLAVTNEARKECRRITSLIWSIVDKKWDDQLDRPLHSAGLYLNPGLYYKSSASSDDYLSIEGNAEVKSGLFKVFNRLVPDFDENDKLVGELILYRDALKSFGEPQAIRSRETLAPAEWWITFGSSAKTLQKVAIRVLSQTCSASPCERNWSAFDNIHSKKRNCLLQKKLNDLVFIQYNKKLERRFYARANGEDTSNPIFLKEVDENDDWVIPTDQELQDFVREGDDLTWTQVDEAMGPTNDGPNTRNKRKRSDTHPSFSLIDEDNDYEFEDPSQEMEGGEEEEANEGEGDGLDHDDDDDDEGED